jgi:hypothetical protein
VDRIHATFQTDFDDLIDVQIGPNRLSWLPNLIRLVRLESMERETILMGINGNGPYPQFVGASKDARSNLATISYQQFADRSDHLRLP